jgi:hypothetical protein
MANTLTYFAADGYWLTAAPPDPVGTSSTPRILVVSALVDFIPRVPAGFSVFVDQLDHGGIVADTSVSIPIITGRIWEGRLSTINIEDTPTVELLADTPVLGLATRPELASTKGRLVYDVRFRDVVMAQGVSTLVNFGFYASEDNSPIVLTDEELDRLAYAPITK